MLDHELYAEERRTETHSRTLTHVNLIVSNVCTHIACYITEFVFSVYVYIFGDVDLSGAIQPKKVSSFHLLKLLPLFGDTLCHYLRFSRPFV